MKISNAEVEQELGPLISSLVAIIREGFDEEAMKFLKKVHLIK